MARALPPAMNGALEVFTKGQAVTLFGSWDNFGTVRVVNLTVHSCGKKQMVLVDERGAKFEGRHFMPRVQQQDWALGCQVHPRMTADDAHAHALAMGAAIVEHERARYERLIAIHHDAGRGYLDAMRADIARLHEPRVYVDGGAQ